MKSVSAEEYKKMKKDDLDWAIEIVNAIETDKRKEVRYKDSRPITSIKEMLESSAKLFGDNIAFYTKFRKGPYETITYKEFLSDINGLGTKLIQMGLKEKRIAVIGETNYTWSVSDLAVCCGTGCVVPLDKELPYENLKNLVKEAEVATVFFDKKREPLFTRMMAEGDTPLQFLISQSEEAHKTCQVVLEPKEAGNAAGDGTGAGEGNDPVKEATGETKEVPVLSFWELKEEGRALVAKGDISFTCAQIDTTEPAVLLFTSGTTGLAKGILLSHRNFASDLMVAPTVLQVLPTDIFFSVLPIHHTYEFTGNFLMPLYKGAAIAHCEGLKYIVKNMQEVHPTMFLAVPAILEAINKQIWKGIRSKGLEEKAKKGIRLSLLARKVGLDLSDKFFKDVKETLGGKLRIIISGGAAINPEILQEYMAFGIYAVQGYGLSECAPLGALNPDHGSKPNSAGVAFPACGARIDKPSDEGVGEICLKGENVMLGYFNRPDLTEDAIREGWFHTGDLGYIDKDGFIIITGRAKNVIITKNGKNVFPEELEYELSLHEEILESMAFELDAQTKDDTTIAVTVYPDWNLLKEKLGEDLEKPEAVEAYISGIVDAVNGGNPSYKMIRRIFIRHTPLIKNTSNKIIRFNPENKKAN